MPFFAGRNFRAATLSALFVLGASASAFGVEEAVAPILPETRPPNTIRVGVVPLPPLRDAQAQKLLTDDRARRNAAPAVRRTERFDRILRPMEEKVASEDNLTVTQLQELALPLFQEALAERLRTRLKAELVPEGEIKATAPLNPEQAQRLGAQHRCRMLLYARNAKVTLRPASTLELGFWAEIEIPLRAVGEDSRPVPIRFPVSGAAATGRILFTDRYTETKLALLKQAVRQAAGRAAYTLRTGRIPLFSHAEERLALLPVLSPTQADRLRFTAEGRQAIPNGLRDLPRETPTLFAPELLPLPSTGALRAARVKLTLREQGIALASLWGAEDKPEIERVQRLGRLLKTDYVLMARVLDVEVQEDALPLRETNGEPRFAAPQTDAPQSFEGIAEVAGALVRVSDGAVLWRERAQATMLLRRSQRQGSQQTPTDRLAALDAIKFALLELQRRFQRHNEGFIR